MFLEQSTSRFGADRIPVYMFRSSPSANFGAGRPVGGFPLSLFRPSAVRSASGGAAACGMRASPASFGSRPSPSLPVPPPLLMMMLWCPVGDSYEISYFFTCVYRVAALYFLLPYGCTLTGGEPWFQLIAGTIPHTCFYN